MLNSEWRSTQKPKRLNKFYLLNGIKSKVAFEYICITTRQYQLLFHPIGKGCFWRAEGPITWKYYQWEWWTQVICYEVIMLSFWNGANGAFHSPKATLPIDSEFYCLSLVLPPHNVYIYSKNVADIWRTNSINALWYEDECFLIRDNVFSSLFEKSCKFDSCKLFGK